MLWLIKQVFIMLLSFGGFLVTKYEYVSNKPCMVRPTLIDLNPNELNYYPFTIILDKCNGSCNVADDLSTQICVPNKTKC